MRGKPTKERHMKKMILSFCLCLLCTIPALAGGLDTFLDNLNVQAAADRNGFLSSVSSHFGVPFSDVEMIIGSTGSLADAFMVFQLGRMTGFPTDRIMRTYHPKKAHGWGVMAQDLGIKPGSEQFHALKRGDFGFTMRGVNGKKSGGPDGKGHKGGGKDDRNGRGKAGKTDKPGDISEHDGGGKGKKK